MTLYEQDIYAKDTTMFKNSTKELSNGKLRESDINEKDTGRLSYFKTKSKEFCDKTTAHGLSHVMNSERGTLYLVFWRVICVLAFAGIIGHLSLILVNFSKYPTQVR